MVSNLPKIHRTQWDQTREHKDHKADALTTAPPHSQNWFTIMSDLTPIYHKQGLSEISRYWMAFPRRLGLASNDPNLPNTGTRSVCD